MSIPKSIKAFRITSSAGVDLGVYEATDEQGALDAMARDAGCRDAAHSDEVAGAFDGIVEETVSYKQFLAALLELGGSEQGALDWYDEAVRIGLDDTDTAESLARLCLDDEAANEEVGS